MLFHRIIVSKLYLTLLTPQVCSTYLQIKPNSHAFNEVVVFSFLIVMSYETVFICSRTIFRDAVRHSNSIQLFFFFFSNSANCSSQSSRCPCCVHAMFARSPNAVIGETTNVAWTMPNTILASPHVASEARKAGVNLIGCRAEMSTFYQIRPF